MKPIIIEGKDLSDSSEVYGAKPNPFFVYFIYLILSITIVAVVWMSFFKVDIVLDNNGIFRHSEDIYEISSGITGEVKEVKVKDGAYVSKGEVLFTIDIDTIVDSISTNEDTLSDLNLRLEMLYAYRDSLDGTISDLSNYVENPYYEEFYNKRKLLEESILANETTVEGQSAQYKANIESLEASIAEARADISKIEQAIQCVETGINTFDVGESYYKSIIDSYLSNYQTAQSQYDGQVTTLENLVFFLLLFIP